MEIFWKRVKKSMICRTWRECNNKQWIGSTAAEECVPCVYLCLFQMNPSSKYWLQNTLKATLNRTFPTSSSSVDHPVSLNPRSSKFCTWLAPKMILTSESYNNLWFMLKLFIYSILSRLCLDRSISQNHNMPLKCWSSMTYQF